MQTPVISMLLVGALVAGCSDDDDDVDAALIVVNNSDFVIDEVHLTEIDNPDWGPNLLNGDVLLPGEELALGVDCGTFDALLVNEEGVACELHGVNLCLNGAVWDIRNATCAVFDAAQAR
jgi:hypothetical protein